MPFDLVLSTAVGLALLIPAMLPQVAFWQRKEYRWDRARMDVIGFEGSKHKAILYSVIAFLISFSWVTYIASMYALALFSGWAALLVFVYMYARLIRKKGFVRPVFTLKVRFVVVMLAVLVCAYIWLTFCPRELPALQWATFHAFLPFLTMTAVFLVNIPSYIRKQQIIAKAQALRALKKDLVVVGITGSYGKTSTKHFVSQLLATTKLRWAVTKDHRNSYIGVAYDMLEQLSSDISVYIVEMGAYTKGEIAALARLTLPRIGVITAIGNQHLELFGTQQHILDAKWELVDALPKDGMAILNKDDQMLLEKSKTTEVPIAWYSRSERAQVYVSDLVVRSRYITCTMHIGRSKKEVRVPLVSKGLLSSLLAAVTVVKQLGMAPKDIFNAMEHVAPYERTMEIVTGLQGATIIDDSYSGGEAAALNAIEHMSLFRQTDKRIVFIPIIELGVDGPRVHMEIGRALGKTAAKVWIYGDAYKQQIMDGANEAGSSTNIEWVDHPLTLTEHVTRDVSKKTVVLLEGRVPDILRKTLLS